MWYNLFLELLSPGTLGSGPAFSDTDSLHFLNQCLQMIKHPLYLLIGGLYLMSSLEESTVDHRLKRMVLDSWYNIAMGFTQRIILSVMVENAASDL